MSASIPSWVRQAREHWRWRGASRPSFAIEPGPGQESVWDYPRPPVIVPDQREVVIFWGERLIGRSSQALRVLETAHPPSVYLPRSDLDLRYLVQSHGGSYCEWKGPATYWSLIDADEALDDVAWSYDAPLPGAEVLLDHVAFYPRELQCTIGGLSVSPQPGGFYGGWISADLAGPFKGEAGSTGW